MMSSKADDGRDLIKIAPALARAKIKYEHDYASCIFLKKKNNDILKVINP